MILEEEMKIFLALFIIQNCETSPHVIISFSKDMCYERPFQFPPFRAHVSFSWLDMNHL